MYTWAKKIENALISIVIADFHWSHDESGVLDCVGFPPEQHLVIEPALSFRGQIWVVPLPDWSHVFWGGGGWGVWLTSNILTSIPNLFIWPQSLWGKTPISRLNKVTHLLAGTCFYK